MDDALLTRVLNELGTATIGDDAQLLVLGACQGDEQLAAALEDAEVARPEPGVPEQESTPAGAYLTGLVVRGFRGIGSESSLPLKPGPGLTVVTGRNGSGKSSFAEALELLLTGDNLRWSRRPKAWQEGWRNLHESSGSAITADFVEEGVSGSTTVAMRWADDDGLEAGEAVVQRQGQPREPLAALGWDAALTAFRPFLSYNELGSLLDEGPSKLYDALQSILGLEDLVVAGKRLRDARLQRERRRKAVKEALDGLRPMLQESQDPRAGACLDALAGRSWDLDAVTRAVSETPDAAEAALGPLRALSALEAPDADAVTGAVGALRDAADRLDEAADTDAGRASRLADVLDQALELHADHAVRDCPVCGRKAALDEDWRARAQAEVVDLRARAAAVTQAREGVTAALAEARGLTGPAPAVLQAGDAPVDVGPARRAWGTWAHARELDDPRACADHLETHWEDLALAAQDLRRSAEQELTRRQDQWRPLAVRMQAWLADALEAETGMAKVRDLKAAEKGLSEATGRIRDERFRPIARQTERIWHLLRTNSNVELAGVSLEGAATRRRVELDVTVDGVEGAALGVMSQGELHALALSLFLPRATLPESPFRFLVIDDPVQSMDPARVDGLARTLAATAERRQVVVFTHDDRLPEALRRLQLDATVLEVSRRPGSVVEVREVADPVRRLLDDARALAATADLPEAVARRVVPGYCRTALEAACVEVVRRRRLGRGERSVDVEAALEDAGGLTAKMALAIFDTTDRGGDVLRRLNALTRGGAATFQQCQRGTHEGVSGRLHGLVDDTAELVRAVERQ